MFNSVLRRAFYRPTVHYRLKSSIAVSPNLLHLRIGLITDVQLHPNADKLYVSQILLNDEKPIQVCSGLVGLVPQDQLLNTHVVVVCNLKPSKMRGTLSQGMLLCSEKHLKDGSYKVEPIKTPADLEPGSSVSFDIPEEFQNGAKKRIKGEQWETIVTGLKSNSNGEVIWQSDNGSEFRLGRLKNGKFHACFVSSEFLNCSIR